MAVTRRRHARATLVVGRAQVYDGGGRLGYSMTLASPALRSQWWFANGEKGAGVTERFSIYNPTDDDVEVHAAVPRDPGRHRRSLDRPDHGAGPAGRDVHVRHRRRAARRPPRDACSTPGRSRSRSSSSGRSPARSTASRRRRCCSARLSRPPDGYVANTWTLAVGPGEPTEDALVVYNITSVRRDGDGPGGDRRRGRRTCPSLAEVAAAGGGLAARSRSPTRRSLDAQLVVRSTSPVFVERSLPREPGAQGRTPRGPSRWSD